MSERPAVRLLIVAWGKRYVELFADLTLASLLAEGNLPALAAATELEVVILTAEADRSFFEREPRFQALRQLAPVRFIAIDDLIAGGYYGITLTLGYLRGMTAMGNRMVDTAFVFLNADLILADGSLRSLAQRILRGERAILACSIRAVSQDVEPALRALVDARQALSVPPRTLVGMALRAMHPTQIAKIVNANLCHSKHVNQFYWQVDDTTLISRHFLMFMLCIRPERVVSEVHAFCDYAFVPEMCPTLETTAMADSDEFFFLEMQERESERDFLGLGSRDVAEIAAGLSQWTTAEHRKNSLKHTLIFRAGELPASLETSIEAADRYIRAIHARLDPTPQPYRHHPYWTGTLALWRQRHYAATAEKPALPLAHGIFARVFGRPPRLSMLHPEWADYRCLRSALERHANDVVQLSIKDAVSPPAAETPTKHELVVVEVKHAELGEIRRVVECLRARLAPGGELVVFVKSEAATLGADFLRLVDRIAPAEVHRTEVCFAGNGRSRRLRALLTRASSLYLRRRFLALPLAALVVLAVAVRAFLYNLRARRRGRAALDCSSITIRYRA